MSPDAVAVAEHEGRLQLATGSGTLPQGWACASIVELAGADGLMLDGDWVETKDQDPNGEIRLIQLADIGDGIFQDRSDRHLTRKTAERLRCTYLSSSDVLIARMAAPLGRACIFPGLSQRAVTAVDVCIWRGGNAAVEPRWLMHIINSPDVRHLILGDASGTTRQRISGGKLKQLRLPIPPLPEQRRIVARIEELFAEIAEGEAALERARQGLDTWRRALLKAAVTGELTRDWREANRPAETGADRLARVLSKRRETWERCEFAKLLAKHQESRSDRWKARYAEPVVPEISEAVELPDAWAWASVDQLTCGDRTLAYGVLQPGPDIRGGVPLVRVGDINNGRVMRSNLKCISPVIAEEYSRTQLSGGELLMTLVGAIGRTAVAPPELAGANTARAVGMVPLSDLVNADWVELWFRSPAKQIEMVGKAHEVARKTLNLEDVRCAGVAIPPRFEQDRIVAIVTDLLATFDLEEAAFELAKREARALRQSVLKAAFEGRLVPQDPADEPASALLALLRNGHPGSGARRRRARAAADFSHPSLPGLTRQSVDPRVEPAGDE